MGASANLDILIIYSVAIAQNYGKLHVRHILVRFNLNEEIQDIKTYIT